MKEIKRVLSLILCFVMVVGMMPVFVLNAEAATGALVDTAVIFSDLHIDTNATDKEALLVSVLNAIVGDGYSVSSVNSAGDMFSSNEGTMAGNAADVTAWINKVLPNADKNYVWTDHDRAATDISKASGLVYSGNYYVYNLSMADMSTYDRYNAGFSTDAQVTANIEAFKQVVAGLDKTKPLFIVGHQPLLDRRGDNGHAYEWATAINAVAAGMDVTYFFGHNHKYDVAEDYFYAKGDTMLVATDKVLSGSGYNTDLEDVEMKLNFTHVCAGYMDPGTTSGTTRKGTALVVAIYDDAIEYITYDASGKFIGTYAVDESVDRAHAQKLDADYVGVTGAAGIDDVHAFGSDWTTLTEEVPAKDATEGSVSYKYTLDTDGTVTDAENDELGYLIVAPSDNYALTGNGEISRRSVTVANNAITLEEKPFYEWKITSDGKITNGSFWLDFEYSLLGGASVRLVTSSNASSWIFNSQGSGNYRVSADYDSIVGRTYYLRYNNGFSIATSASNLRLFKGTKVEVPGTEATDRVPGLYAYLGGELSYTVTNATTAAEALKLVKDGIAIQYATCADYSDETTYADDDEGMTWTLDKSYDANVPGDYAVTIAYNGNILGIAEVVVPAVTTYYTAEGPAQVVVEEGTSLANAMAAVQSAVTVYTATDALGTGKTAVSDDSVTWEWLDDYNNNAPGPYTVSINKGGNTIATVEVAVNTENEAIDPGTGDSASVTIGGTTYEEKVVYVPATTLTNNGKYLIVNESKNQMLINSNGTDGSAGVTVKNGTVTVGNATYSEYIENSNSSAVWTATANGTGFYLSNDGEYLRPRNNSDMVSGTAGAWSYNASTKQLSGVDGRTTYYVRYDGSEWKNSTTASSVLLYQAVTAKIPVDGRVTYTMKAEDLSVVLPTSGTVTGQLSYALLADGETAANLPAGGSYKFLEVSDNDNVVGSISDTGVVTFTGTPGTAKVRVAYTWTSGSETYTVYKNVTVEARAPYYSIELHDKAADGSLTLIEAPVAKKGVVTGQTMNVWAVVKVHDADHPTGEDLGALGNALSWSVSDPAIATIDTATGVITFTGAKYGTFQVTVSYKTPSGEVVTDTIVISASESQFIVPGDGTDDFPTYPNEGAVRFDKTASAVGNFSETGIAQVELSMTGVPFTTENRMDVVLMLDRSSSMYKSGVQHRISSTVAATKAFIKGIVTNEDGSFNNNRILVLDFLGGNLDRNEGGGSSHKFQSNRYTTVEENGYQVINSEAELDALLTKIETDFKGQTSLYGTEYAQGLEACYNALAASKADGNQQFCVFMSDGIPNYMMGETTHFKKTDDIVATFNVTNYNTSSAVATRNATKYEYEHYSTQMKNDGVTVYTVGLGLKNTNSAWSNASAAACEQVANMLLNDIAGPAGETAAQRDTGSAVSKLDKYFFSVTDDEAAENMDDVFGTIAQKILEAAKDVVVEDKIKNDYTLNFKLPLNVTSDATNGLNEFYIQAVEYQLNPETKERTGEPTVLERFTFGVNGDLKSHVVDGVTCANCSHVTFRANNVSKIDGTYFDYSAAPLLNADGSEVTNEFGTTVTEEYLHWNAEKLTTTELALQYFVYLDNSAGYAPDEQVDPGTYFTNEYATLTYTNYKGNRVQQEFPIPQMTWNGAQVSYVFYLVNAAGQPVNRAGRVVPFAEAVYVTDVHTYSIVWNDMEQSAGLAAEYLAVDLVPEVYALYDNHAGYDIHVYEDEELVNLNNHFVIRGDVTDDYNTSKGYTNARTTYVFNTKSDATKYTAVGAYVHNGVTQYLCKDYAVSNAEYEEVTEGLTTYHKVTKATYTGSNTQWKPGSGDSYTGGTLINGCVYYVDEEGKVYTIVVKTDASQVRTGFDFSNTTVAFAVVWKPELAPDAVVVDYGLDVLIDVTTNDSMAAGLVGVRSDAPSNVAMNSGTYEAAKAQTTDVYIDANGDANGLKELKIGTASVENMTTVRFSLDKQNGMQFTEAAKFYYESGVNFYNSEGDLLATSMYSSVTVIPATSVYYEDDFIQFASFTKDASGKFVEDESSKWATMAQSGVQDQDRPGASKISEILDADNNYGYDAAYENMSTFSMGSAAKFTVNADTRGEAYFSFYGTGFDVIGLTSNTTGTILVQVSDADGKVVKNTVVDTYYGYTKNADGEWVLTNAVAEGDADGNALYQVPVIKIFDLPYAKYNVKIMAVYSDTFNHTATEGSYDLYLDAVRIYDPTGNQDSTSNDAYKEDGESYPEYFEVRNQIISKNTFDSLNDASISGVVFIDGIGSGPSIADYKTYGPNNEVYLENGQAIAFDLNATAKIGEVLKVQLAVKTVGGSGRVEVYGIHNGVKTVALDQDISTATDLYFDITELNGQTVVIRSTGDAIISITNVKVTYTLPQPAQTTASPAAASPFSLRRTTADVAIDSLRVEEIPEPTAPVMPEPEEGGAHAGKPIIKIIKGLLDWIFG